MVSKDSAHNSSSMLHQFIISDSITGQSQFENQPFDHTRHLMDLLGASNETNHQQAQRLSLSLNSDMLVPSVQFRQRPLNPNLISPSYFISEAREACNPRLERISDEFSIVGNNNVFASSSASLNQSCSAASYGMEFFVGNSKYLKPAQILLEEMANVGGKVVELRNERYIRKLSKNSKGGSVGLGSELKAELCSNGLSGERHELQAKTVKLISLLEEVERRYEQYYHQLEEVVSSFEMIAGAGAGAGAGKSYTALALQAMSRHFCSLRDAITSQIIAAKGKLCQDSPKINTGFSQLSLFDKEARQNRLSLQHLGMVQGQRQAWRPIRGLPETSVTILRSWLFEHFLHPYPNDSEKLMLASQTSLTKNQVSNWFINARVRLWKPMIEDMYKEEFADNDSADSDPMLASNSLQGDGEE